MGHHRKMWAGLVAWPMLSQQLDRSLALLMSWSMTPDPGEETVRFLLVTLPQMLPKAECCLWSRCAALREWLIGLLLVWQMGM